MSRGDSSSLRNRQPARSRNPVELRVVGCFAGITVLLALLTIAVSPLGGPWNSPFLRLLVNLFSAGLVVPANFGHILLVTLAFATVTAFIFWWALRTYVARTAAGKKLEQLLALSPDQFEEWVGARFGDLGYAVRVIGMEGDHGVDLLVERPGETVAVQCKKYRNWTVGEPVLRDLLGAMQHYGAKRGYLVTTGRVTQPAIDWVAGKPIEILDGDALGRLSIQWQRLSPAARARELRVPAPVAPAGTPIEAPVERSRDLALSTAITCPECGTALAAWQHNHTGEYFLGCTRYPHCSFTQPMPDSRP